MRTVRGVGHWIVAGKCGGLADSVLAKVTRQNQKEMNEMILEHTCQ